MININGKDWLDATAEDVKIVLDTPEFEESFFFEFKSDQVSTHTLAKEVSALANTYGGYVFVGISDNTKDVEGCTRWNEERILAVIHDTITPIPVFDVRSFYIAGKCVIVLKVEEGAEPPYITNRGEIYERISSASCKITDSNRLSHLYSKNEKRLERNIKKINIEPLPTMANNIYGYLDIGFSTAFNRIEDRILSLSDAELEEILAKSIQKRGEANLFQLGMSLVFTPGALSLANGGIIPAHINNFMEIMSDGSARMRILLSNNNPEESTVNFFYASILLNSYKRVYQSVLGEQFAKRFVYAKKYESITAIKQFQPVFFYDNQAMTMRPELKEENERFIRETLERRIALGINTVITNDRIPKTGLYTIDKRTMESAGLGFNDTEIMQQLFFSSYINSVLPLGPSV